MDLVNLGHRVAKDIPELHETFFGIAAKFGQLVFAARMEKKLTQNRLAELADVSQKTIHRIEGGSGGITVNTYEKVFAALELSDENLADALKRKLGTVRT